LAREDSIHIRIKIDIDTEDRAFIENLSTEIARADEQRLIKREPEKKVDIEARMLEEEIQKIEDEIIKRITQEEKEGPRATKLRKEIGDLKEERKEKDYRDSKEVLEEKLKGQRDRLLIKQWKEGPVGIVAGFTTEQAANLRKFVTNPAEILVSAFTKKLGKIGGAAAKGGLYAIIALLVYETVLFVIDQFMQPGRWLDRRFKRIARLEAMNFYERTLQEEIRHGYQEIRVATMAGLRGGASQVNGNFFEFSSGATGMIQSSPYRNSQDIYQSQNATGSVTDSQGNPRRRNVFFGNR